VVDDYDYGAEKTEEQLEMERYLQPIKYGGKEISTFEDIAEFISFPALNRERIKAAPK